MKFNNKGYNYYQIEVEGAITVSTSKVVGDANTLKKCMEILKRGGADFKGTIGETEVQLPNAFGMNDDVLVVRGISEEEGTQTVYTGELAMGTGVNKNKLLLTMHTGTV